MHRRYLAPIITLMFLSGCAQSSPTAVVSTIWPNVPNVPELPPLTLKPVDFTVPNADSFIALDYTNWLNYQYNMQALGLQIGLYKERISAVNLQRAEWRKLNEQNNDSNNSAR